ncbi:CBS domain-containing protein [Sphingomicrobium sediminis]|uniref:CBS domain-containing protein n=1 Tax=Sphingomicrobium sediminis TaxID=2950949 RepID=A0A9X2J2R7_9SPHN|nr:CBS domain-containing protein [Sphingomicrobium sediminis]MCM8556571.1 CBS domain-containing protein [Sphingomicrobium sediminis]
MRIIDRAEYKTKPAPMTGSADMMVADAAKRMSEKNYGSIIIVDDAHRVTGMLTERDLMRRVIAEGRDPGSTKVSEVMTSEVRTANADDELVDWLRIMSNERFRRLPIVDGDQKLVSIMTQGDFVSYTWPELLDQAKALAKATIGENISLPMILFGILAYTVVIIIAVSFAT